MTCRDSPLSKQEMKPSSSSSSSSSSPIRKPSHYLFPVLSLIVFVGVALYGEVVNDLQPKNSSVEAISAAGERKTLPFARSNAADSGEVALEGCDVFSGKWVWDDSSHRPLYDERDCPFLPPQVTCQEHGRPDRDYQFWRWKPHACSLPSFDAGQMLESLRGKRMMFVGDSLNRGQFESMICLLNSVIPANASSFTKGSTSVFTAKEYNASVEFYWAPFLLESNSDNPMVHKIALSDRVVRKGSIHKHGVHWKGVDIMVFNTYLWWMTGLKMKILRSGSFEDEFQDIIEVSTEEAYRLAMKSMLRWVQNNMDLRTTRVFFVTRSPSHQKSQDWGSEAGGNCYNETTMIEDAKYWGSDCRKSVMQVIDEVFTKSPLPITLLNITQLSSYRKDGHTSIYKKQWSPLTKEQIDNPTTYADCVHWCLPGVQDVWNELLFTKLFYP